MKRTIFACVLLLTLLVTGPLAVAQVLYGTVVGTVTDPDGHPLAGATVTATETQTGILHTQTTDAQGGYGLHDLLPGVYTMAVAANGFSTQQTSGLTVSANVVVRLGPASFIEQRGADGGSERIV